MEPLDNDFDYAAIREKVAVQRRSRSISRTARFNFLLIIPALALLWVLYLIGAAVFQWRITDAVNPIMTLMIFLFLLAAAILFWATAPKSE